MPRSRTRLASSPHCFARHIASRSPSRYETASRTPYEYTVMGPMLNSSGYTWSSHSEDVENHQSDADGDRGIGDVERPEVPGAIVRVHEVENIPVGDPVDEVAGRATDDQRQAQTAQALTRVERGGVDRQSR